MGRTLLLFAWLLLGMVAVPQTFSEPLEQSILVLCNRARLQAGVPPLEWDGHLALAARGHSRDMAEFDFFDHESPVPQKHDTEARVRQAGGRADLVAENLFWSSGHGCSTVASMAVDNWLHSEGHRENLLGREYAHLGVGVFQRGQTFWITQVFGP
ncbi:CAP domain-containing protein [bacterium]|nr:CAP domain-containing protein [bacterium]